MRFQLQNPSDKSWSFSLLSNEGDVLLNSSTFTSRDEAVDYIRQSIQALRTDQRIRISGTTFELTDADGVAIGSSIKYNTQEAARTASELLQMQANGTEDFAVEFTTTTTTTTTTRRKLATKIPTAPSRAEMTVLYNVTRSTITGNMGFDLFEEDGKYYYLFNSSNGYPMLYSKGFDNSSKRKTNIRSTLRYAGKDKYYEKVEENGQHYFIIKTPNGFECARSARYATAADRDTAITYFIANSPDYKKEYAKPTKKAREAAQEYVFDRPSTSNDKGFEAFRNDEKRKHYFHFNNDQGQPILFSQGYKGGKARDNGIRSVIKNSINRARFKIKEKGGQWFFVLLAANNTEIARSQMLVSEAEAQKGIDYVLSNAKGYATTYEVDLTPKTKTTSSTETFNLNVDIPEEPKVDEAALAMAAAATLAAENAKKEEEAARIAAEAEAKRKAEEAAAAKKAEEARLAAEAEAKRKADAEKRAAQAEADRKAAIEQRAAELEAKRKADEAKRTAEAEAKRKAEEARRAAELEAKRKADAEAEARRADEAKKAAAAAALAATTALAAKKADDAKKAEALAAQQKAEADKRAAQAEKDRLAAQAKREEEAKLAAAKKAEDAKRAERARIAAEEEKAKKAKAHAERLAAQAERKKEKAAAVAMAAATTTASSGGGNNGDEYGGGSWFGKNWWWLLALLLALLALMYFLRGCEGCAKKAAVVAPVEKPVVKPEPKEEVKEIVPVKEEPKAPRGKTGAELGFAKGSLAYRMADCLADPDCILPSSYNMDVVQFTTGEAHMSRGAYPTVDDLAKLMKAYPNMNLGIVGHIDGTEKDAYNGAYQDGSGITLSEIRSRCLYKKLQKRGIPKSRLKFSGKGKTQNTGNNNTASGRQENRRLELIMDLK